MTEATFPARIRKSGDSKVVTIPEVVAKEFVLGEIVQVEINHRSKK